MHFVGFRSLVAVHELVADGFPFLERFVTVAQDAGMVNENILPCILQDESKSPFVVEPLHFSAGHNTDPSMSCVRGVARRTRETTRRCVHGVLTILHPNHTTVNGRTLGNRHGTVKRLFPACHHA